MRRGCRVEESEEAQATGRLGGLEKVTREYGHYSELSGLPLVALGAWVAAGAAVLRWVGDGPARLLMLALPRAWVAFALASARLYQRREVVVTTTRFAKRWPSHLFGTHAFIGVCLVLAGLCWHLRFRRLERRFLELRVQVL
jgi:hypothetical protein